MSNPESNPFQKYQKSIKGRATRLRWIEKNPTKQQEYNRNYYRNHSEKRREARREYHKKNYLPHPKKRQGREKDREVQKLYQKANPEKVREITRRWNENNREKYLLVHRLSQQKRRSTLKGKLSCNMADAIGKALRGKKNGLHWEILVSYSVINLKNHLEKKFLPGMSWENRSEWEIDHIIPIAAFNYELPSDMDFLRCWSLKNLRPLWKHDNRKKQDKLEKPFQPSLTI